VKRKEMMDGLCELDMIAKERPLNEDERLRKEDISRELERSFLEEASWRQKSRALWLREGDKNTKKFHRLANLYGRHNSVEPLVVNGNMTSDSIEEHIVNFYKQLYVELYNWRLKLAVCSFLSTDVDERNWMEREFEESEMLEVVRNFNGDKALGPNGFSMDFCRSFGRY